ncbi:hypothetical protein [Pyrococcus kukulkanii]|uniref:hypothetical protein n=1 Tax=Pyrococcus kukulkanii TaxID=1609559 RepID=UPI003569CA07
MDEDLKRLIPPLIIFVLLVQVVHLHFEISELKNEIKGLKSQQRQYTQIIWSEYGRDIYATIEYLQKTRPDIMKILRNASLAVSEISTQNFHARYDAKEGVFWVWYDPYSYIERDIVYIELTAYYQNGTRVKDFPEIEYQVNHTTGEILGVSRNTAERTVERAYLRLRKNITASIGLKIIQEASWQSLGVFPDDGKWVVVEMKCASTKNISLCWFVIGEVDKKTGMLRKLEVTRPFQESDEKEVKLRMMKESNYSNPTAREIKRSILNMTGGLLLNITFSNS